MSNSNLFIAGSIHQGSERFSDVSHGRQCSFMSFSALFAHTLPTEQWTASDVDQILAQGDRFYLHAFENRSIPDRETLSLDYLPFAVDGNSMQICTRQTNNSLLRAESKANNLPPWADVQSPNRVTNSDLPVTTQNSQSNTFLWLVDYKEFYQGRTINVFDEHENHSLYYTLRSALMNVFSNNNYAFIILEGYTMALLRSTHTDCIYLFDSHSRNVFGMPDPKGTAVVMKFANVFMLEQHLFSLSHELNSQFFEVVPVEFHICSFELNAADAPTTKKMRIETETQRKNRLQKARDYKQRMIANETDTDREIRLQKNNAL